MRIVRAPHFRRALIFNPLMSRSKHLRWIVPLALVGAVLLLGKTMNTNPPTNRAQTSPDASDADLRTRVYSVPLDEVAAQVRALHLSTYGRGWKMVPGDARGEIVFRVPVIVFSDVLTVSLQPQSEGKTRVDVESHSLVGQGDFGENRRHVRQLLRALDAVLPRA